MKKVVVIILTTILLFSWEVNTHRAIDRSAISNNSNLKSFIKNSKIDTSYEFIYEEFEGYKDKNGNTFTYYKYITEGEKGGISDWNQTFTGEDNIADAIEAGTILEDATWPKYPVFGANGRFNNHFYEAQNNGKALTYGYGAYVDAVNWASGEEIYSKTLNKYCLANALEYFKKGFTDENYKNRRKYQAKLLVSVGHLLHVVNDMNVPAHVRDDSHPLGDPLEVWMRGGAKGYDDTGFYVRGSTVANQRYSSNTYIPQYSNLKRGMVTEAEYTSENFFSKDTIFYKEYSPTKDDVIIPELDPNHPADYDYITDSSDRKLAVVYWSSWFGTTRKAINYSVESNIIHQEYGKILIPRAIANATGFLNYFFRGSIDASVDSSGILTIKNNSNSSLVASPDVVTFNNGKFEIYYDDSSSNRAKLTECEVDTLLPNESITCDISSELQNVNAENLIIIYDGTIGQERGLAVKVIDAPTLGGGDNLNPPTLEGGVNIVPIEGGFKINSQEAQGEVDRYEFYRSTTTGELGEMIYSGSVNSYEDIGLTDGTTYYYTAKACNDAGCDTSNQDYNTYYDNSGGDDDPTQDPNKVCVSNYFNYYGDGKIHDDLKIGDKDAELYSDGTKHQVKELQEFLMAFGYDVGSSGADGWFGDDTKDAVVAFQSANGLNTDGIIGPNTKDVMNSLNCFDK